MVIAPDAAVDDVFGAAVAIDGDTIVIGAPGRNFSGMDNSGAAYVFTHSKIDGNVVWVHQATLTASQPTNNDEFGNAVAISGDSIAIGAWLDNAVYVFMRTEEDWIEQAKLTSPSNSPTTVFGRSIALSGNIVAVGDTGEEIDGISHAGSVHIFARANNQWNHQAALPNPDPQFSDMYGNSVAISHDSLIVGVWLDDHEGGTNAGSALVFGQADGTWGLEAKLTATDAMQGDGFGESVALEQDVALIGARSDDHSGQTNNGASYLYTRSGGQWTQQAKIIASDPSSGDQFGKSVALNVEHALVGAFGDNQAAGTAYVFDVGCHVGDITQDGTVNMDDLLALISAWGPCPAPCAADVDGNGVVNVHDLLLVIANWG